MHTKPLAWLTALTLCACADLDQGARYQATPPLDADTARLVAEAEKRALTNDPDVTAALEKALIETELATRQKALQRALTDEEQQHVRALLTARTKDLAATAAAAGYTQHPLVVPKLITALENDELAKVPPTKAKLKAVFDEHVQRFDENDRAPPAQRLHPELLYVRVWETKNKALASALPKLKSTPTARDVGPITRRSAALPEPVVAAAFAIDKPQGFSAPLPHDGGFMVVQRVTKLPATPFSEEVARTLYERERRPAIRRALLAK